MQPPSRAETLEEQPNSLDMILHNHARKKCQLSSTSGWAWTWLISSEPARNMFPYSQSLKPMYSR